MGEGIFWRKSLARFFRAQKTTPGVQMEKPICPTASSRAFLIGDEKCGVEVPSPDRRRVRMRGY